MGLFSRKKSKAADTNTALLARIDGRLIRYVTRRDTDENGSPRETVLGKEGRIHVQPDYVAVSSNGKEVFRCTPEDVKCGELMSLEGVVFTGINQLTGQMDTVVAYYKYYR